MYIFYDLEQIATFKIFSNIDFSTFSPFENIMVVLGVNIFYLLFIAFSISIIYKTVTRIYNAIF